jgi:hypothetical protein
MIPISKSWRPSPIQNHFSEILGVSRREISHTGFLAWLFNNLDNFCRANTFNRQQTGKFVKLIIENKLKARKTPTK